MTSRLRLVWEGDFSPTSSVGQVNIELARLVAEHVDLSIATATKPAAVPEPLRPYLGQALPSVDIHLRHGAVDDVTPPRQGAWVWMQAWELGAAPPVEWVTPMRHAVDAVLVYSPWIRDHFVAAGVPPERVMVSPPGVDVERFSPHAAALTLPTTKRFRFLNISGTSLRKGHDLLLRAYLEAFSAADDVALVLKTFANDGRYESVGLLGFERAFASSGAPEVVRVPPELPPADLPGLYTSCHAYVHPYRGEGFCLPLAEAMASGLPIITTDRGGASAFCTAATAQLLTSRTVYLPRLRLGRRTLSNFPHWQEPSLRELIAAMRALSSKPAAAHESARCGRALIAESFTWRQAADVLLTNLEVVRSRPARRGRHDACRPQVTVSTVASHESSDTATVSRAKNQVLARTRSAVVCFLADGQDPGGDFRDVLRDCVTGCAGSDSPILAARVVHYSAAAALAPLERFVPCVVRARGGWRFDPHDGEVVRNAQGESTTAREVPNLVIHQRGGEPLVASTPIAHDVRRVLLRHRDGDSTAALETLRVTAARWQCEEAQPLAHRSFLLTSYIVLSVAAGACEEAERAAAGVEWLCGRQPAYWVARGEALMAMGRIESAATSFHRAIGLELQNGGRRGDYGRTAVKALLGLAAVATSQGIVENAYRFHRYALAQAPNDQSLTLRVAELADSTGRADEAVALLARALTGAAQRGGSNR